LQCGVLSAVASPKTMSIPIPGSECFAIRIDNPGPYDVSISQSIYWTQTVPSDVEVTVLDRVVTVPAGQSRSLYSPCVYVGSEGEPGEYPLDIMWTGTDSVGNPVEFNTDPAIHLYFGPSGGGAVGGVGLPVDKLGLVAPVLGRFLLMAGLVLSVIVWRKKRGTRKEADGL